MDSNARFAALEMMCHERAAIARKEMDYWLAEADEWKRLRKSPDPFIEEVVPTQLDCCDETNSH